MTNQCPKCDYVDPSYTACKSYYDRLSICRSVQSCLNCGTIYAWEISDGIQTNTVINNVAAKGAEKVLDKLQNWLNNRIDDNKGAVCIHAWNIMLEKVERMKATLRQQGEREHDAI